MKRKPLLPLVFVGFSLIIACSKKPSTPNEVAIRFFDLLYNQHNIEEAELLVTVESREKLRSDFKFIEGALQIVEDEKPVNYTYTIDEKKSSVKNDSAFIVVVSSIDTAGMKTLLLKQNDQWLIDFNYDERLLAPVNSDLVDDVLRQMEKFVDSVTVEK